MTTRRFQYVLQKKMKM
ncbi:hypothetical protein Goarm_022240 [Gossypium armourianum]|uniref:Uncharacterized protein n=1 Tax=Gossypium armourianum TaxID=34283 RepID=A0A7J9KFI9_9ROSI|nr:hypothetical protein [Gossypium armourianum]